MELGFHGIMMEISLHSIEFFSIQTVEQDVNIITTKVFVSHQHGRGCYSLDDTDLALRTS
jgi:hypothetical protein